MPTGSLESFCGRGATFLAGEIESNACASLSLRLDGGMADDACEDQRCCLEGQITVPDDRYNCWVCGAMLRDGRERRAGRFRWLHRSCAVMCAIPSAAGREIHVGRSREGEDRRDQREAEEEKQDDAGDSPHHAIVASFCRRRCQRDVCDGPWHQPELSWRQG
jgi:hypothetical protein